MQGASGLNLSSRTVSRSRKSGRETTSRSGLSRLDASALLKRRDSLRAPVTKLLPRDLSRDEVDAHFSHMPLRYWRNISPEDIVWHLKALNTFFRNLLDDKAEAIAPVVKWRHFPKQKYSEALVCTWNRHGLFAKVAGSFAMTDMNILHADIYTRSDHLILDLFQVCDSRQHSISSKPKMTRMSNILKKSLSGVDDVPFSDILKQEHARTRAPKKYTRYFTPKIEFDNETSNHSTILRLRTPDRQGLLYDILQILTLNGLDIAQARVQTKDNVATDEFHITDTRGSQITDLTRMDTIKDLLVEMIGHQVARAS